MPMPPPGPQSISSRLFFPLCRANFRRNPAGSGTGFVGRSPWTAADALVRLARRLARRPAAGGGPPPGPRRPPPPFFLRGGRGGRPRGGAPAPHGFTDVGYLSEADTLRFFLVLVATLRCMDKCSRLLHDACLVLFAGTPRAPCCARGCGTKPCLFLHR